MVVELTLKFLKTMVAEDAIIMEEVLVVDLAVEDAKADLIVREADLVLEERVDLEEKEVVLLQEEKAEEMVEDLEEKEVVLLQEENLLLDLQIELRDVQKALEILQDQEDLEEVNVFR